MRYRWTGPATPASHAEPQWGREGFAQGGLVCFDLRSVYPQARGQSINFLSRASTASPEEIHRAEFVPSTTARC